MQPDEHPRHNEQSPVPSTATPTRTGRSRQVVDFRPYPTALTRTRRSPANSGRRETRRGDTPSTPSTVWFAPTLNPSTPEAAVTAAPRTAGHPLLPSPGGAPDPEPSGPAWPLSALTHAVTSFTGPGATVLLLPWPVARDEDRGDVPTAAIAAVADLGRRPRLGSFPAPTGRDDADHARPDDADERADLMVTVMPARHDAAAHTDPVARFAARALRLGGVLAVLTRCDRRDEVLVDPTGPMVTAGQNADLLYLQHVVAVELPPANLCTRDRRTDVGADGAPPAHRRVHSDVLVFAQPHDAGARPAARPSRP